MNITLASVYHATSVELMLITTKTEWTDRKKGGWGLLINTHGCMGYPKGNGYAEQSAVLCLKLSTLKTSFTVVFVYMMF